MPCLALFLFDKGSLTQPVTLMKNSYNAESQWNFSKVAALAN